MTRARSAVNLVVLLRLVHVFVMLGSPALARAADGPGEEDEGKARFAAGSAYFKKGDYQRALTEFQAGYALARLNGFLLNIGLCQRQLGQKEAALNTFRSLLEREPNFGRRGDVERYIRELEIELGLLPKDTPAPMPAPAAAPARVETPATTATVVPPKREDKVEPETEEDDEDDPADEIALVTSRKADPARKGRPPETDQALIVQSRANQAEREDSGSWNLGLWLGAAALLAGIVAGIYLFSPEPAPRGSIGTIDLR